MWFDCMFLYVSSIPKISMNYVKYKSSSLFHCIFTIYDHWIIYSSSWKWLDVLKSLGKPLPPESSCTQCKENIVHCMDMDSSAWFLLVLCTISFHPTLFSTISSSLASSKKTNKKKTTHTHRQIIMDRDALSLIWDDPSPLASDAALGHKETGHV